MRRPLHKSRRFADHQPARLEWHPPLSGRQRARRRPIMIAAATGIAFAGGGFLLESALHPMPRLVWNASASAPIGLYSVTPIVPLRVGDMIIARLADPVARLAAERHYLPIGVPLVKRVGAVSGDRICAIGATITINGRPVATRLAHDRSGRPLPWWQGCTTLRDSRVFLLSTVPDSFDSRYFGPVEASAIIGRAKPLWTEPAQASDHG